MAESETKTTRTETKTSGTSEPTVKKVVEKTDDTTTKVEKTVTRRG